MTKPNISVFFPIYNDEKTVRRVTEKAIRVLKDVADQYEVIIVNDGSPDLSGKIADDLAKEYECVSVIHHQKNMGYGIAIKTGFKNVKYEWICFTDGDDEYDLDDLRRLIRLKDFYELIITFRYVKLYSTFRVFVSGLYNKIVRFLFKTKYRDISTGLRLIKKEVADELMLISDSPFIGAEITLRTMLKGYRVGEMGIQTFPREIGQGSSTSMKNILSTIKDLRRVFKEIFSDSYDLPENRTRK